MNEDGHENLFPSGELGLGPIAVHPVNKVFAVAEPISIKPKISIYEYPTFQLTNELTGNVWWCILKVFRSLFISFGKECVKVIKCTNLLIDLLKKKKNISFII